MRAVGATFAGRGAEDIAIGACRRQIDSDAGGREPTGIDQKRMAIVYAKDKQTLAQALASDGRSWDFRDGGITFDECSATYQYPSGGLQYHLLYIMLHEAAHLFQACLADNLRSAPGWYNEGSADLLSSHVWEAGRQRLTLSILKATDINWLDLALREDLFEFLGRLGCRLQTMRRAPPRDIPPRRVGVGNRAAKPCNLTASQIKAPTRGWICRYPCAPSCVEALGTLNRLLGRSGVPIDNYLKQWEASCAELQASPLLPTRLREMLRISR